MIDAHNWADGDGSSLEGEVAIGGIKVPMRLAWGAAESPNTMAIPGAKPKTLADFQALARSLQDGDKIHMNVSFDFIPSRAQRALVRIGYLTLFESYGYQYVLSGAGKRVRRVIDGDDADQLWQFTPELRNIEETKITNPIIITPVGSGAHLIIVRISAAKRTCHYAVVMPASSVPEGSVPSVISEIVTRLQGNQLAIQVNA
jgi:hypothetical protein